MNARITISLPEELLVVLDELAQKWNTGRSGAVAKLIKRVKKEELEAWLRQGYLELAEENRRDAEFFLHAQYEVVRENGN